MKLKELAERLECRLEGEPGVEIHGVAGIEQAGPGERVLVSVLSLEIEGTPSGADADLIERRSKRHQSIARHAAIARHHGRDPAKRTRLTDRPARIRSE